VLILLRGTAAFAQASIQGRVVGPNGHPVREARVVLKTLDGVVLLQANADAEGRVLFASVEPGNYRLVGAAPGFYQGEYDIVLRPRQALLVTIELASQSAMKQQVEVRSSYGDLDPGLTGASRFFTRQSLQSLPSPITRSVPELALNIFPGASLSHDNFVHVRGNEVSLHEFINGVGFLDNPQEQFGPGMSPQEFESVDMISGWFPAEFGNRFGGVLDISTRSGFDLKNHGSANFGMGSYNNDDLNGEVGGQSGKFAYYLFADGYQSDWFLNPPEPQALHDFGHGLRTSAQLDYRGDRDSLKFLLLGAGSNFEIPNNDDDQPEGRDAERHLRSQTSILTWQHIFTPRSLVTSSVYERTVGGRLLPTTDPVTEFGDGSRSDLTLGVKSDFAYTANGHAYKTGFDLTRLRLLESFAFDSRMSAPLPPDELPAFAFEGGAKGGEVSLYGQDHFSPVRNLELDLGIRYDYFNLISTFAQVSPRVGVAYHLPNLGSTFHFAYSRFFTPHPIEYAVLASFLGTTAADPDQRVGAVKAYVQNYFEAGWEQRLQSKVFLELNLFHHNGRNPVEYREIGETRLFLPINSARARSKGADVALVLKPLEKIGLSGRLQYAYQRTYFFGPISGGFANGEDKEPGERFLPAFDETHTGTASAVYNYPWRRAWSGFSLRYGSGTVAMDGAVRLPSHLTADFSTGIALWKGEGRGLDLEFNVTNISDNRFSVAKESEETPIQFAPPRMFLGHLKWRF
jgi:outer membrane receptor for ferrienterochelin and colicins